MHWVWLLLWAGFQEGLAVEHADVAPDSSPQSPRRKLLLEQENVRNKAVLVYESAHGHSPFLPMVWLDFRIHDRGKMVTLDEFLAQRPPIRTHLELAHGGDLEAVDKHNGAIERSLAKQLLQRIIRWTPAQDDGHESSPAGLHEDKMMKLAMYAALRQCTDTIWQAHPNFWHHPQDSQSAPEGSGPSLLDVYRQYAALTMATEVLQKSNLPTMHIPSPYFAPNGEYFAHFIERHKLQCGEERFLAPFLTMSPEYDHTVVAPLLAAAHQKYTSAHPRWQASHDAALRRAKHRRRIQKAYRIFRAVSEPFRPDFPTYPNHPFP